MSAAAVNADNNQVERYEHVCLHIALVVLWTFGSHCRDETGFWLHSLCACLLLSSSFHLVFSWHPLAKAYEHTFSCQLLLFMGH